MTSGDHETDFLQGGGEMGARIRAKDWSATPLGPPERWPQSLKTAVRIMLTSRQAMFVWWGEELINLYNDPYMAIVGGKHPEALGQPASVVWREIWDQVGPRTETVLELNEGTYDESLLLIMERHGYPEETYYTFSYSPVPGDQGGTEGIICANTDDTQRILGERQLALLRELASRMADARTLEDACALSAACLETNPFDIPFAMIYLIEPGGRSVSLAATCGIERGHPAVPETASLDGTSIWPFAEAAATHEVVLTENPGAGLGLPAGAWKRPPHQAVAIPIAPSGQTGKAGILIAGLSPFRLFDDNYQGFLNLVAAQIAAGIANAQAYEDERRRAESLAELDRAKTAFFSNVSHEFRTPLTLMLGPLDDILAKPEDEVLPDNRELLTVVRRNGQRLLKLVNSLLDFSRIEAGRVQAIYEPVDLSAFTADLASVFRAAVEKAGMRLVIDCPPLPEPVFVDRDMWEKIVLNLVSNAFKYTLQGEIRVALRLEDGSAVLSVRDTGTGIPEAELPNLFNRFHRVEGARGRTQEGTGIGLALVQELARLHGGVVRAGSVEGAGSTFTVTLPLGNAHLPADRIGAGRTPASTALGAMPFVEEALRWLPSESGKRGVDLPLRNEPPAGTAPAAVDGRPVVSRGRPRVVLADDNADMRDYVRRLLSADYEVVAVGDGEEALQAIAASPPDLVLSDVMMPKLDGFGLLQALRADPRTASIPIVLLSARAGEEARVEGLQVGADDYLTKPFSARELLARVGALLELARVRREAEEALRESEARFRHMADNAPVMVWVTEPDGACSYLSRSWYDFTGQTPATGLGFGWVEAVHPDDRAMAEQSFIEANARREPFRLEYRLRRHDGEYLWAIDAASPRLGPDGQYLGYIGSVIDITDRKHAEDALREADRRKDEFLATLAHELRNPLAPLRNGLQILRLAGDNPAAAERAYGLMERQLKQMVHLIDDLLDVSRISRGAIELRKEDVGLAALLESAVETSRPMIEASRHQLTVDLPPEPIFVNADVTRLAQVFSNLLNNAAKFTPAGGQIRLAVEPRGSEVTVTVEDNGLGIPAAMLPRVFDMFTQVDHSLERSQGGLGIGLSIVKRLVEMHEGTVEAWSAGRDQGSRLTVRLPVVQPAAPEPQEKPEDAPIHAAVRRILVADDNEDSASSLAMMLEILGNEVATASDGQEAVETATRLRPDVILLDIGMPRMNGYDACRCIRQEPWGKDVLLIALTGWGQEEDVRRSREAGFDHHLVKPVELSRLEALLGERPPSN